MFWIKTASMAFADIRQAAASDWDILGAVLAAGPVVKGVMLLLLAFSIISWAIIIAKFRQLHRARQETAAFLTRFWQSPTLAAALESTGHLTCSPAAVIFRQGYAALTASHPAAGDQPEIPPGPRLSRDDAAQRAVRGALSAQVQLLTQSLSFLATCGNTAPFIGLFGTVWGIMSSFHQIGLQGSASLATVAPGIAEALIATAAGLAAAIPAVMAYNYFLGQVRQLEADLESFAADLVDLLKSP
jgi:biopolymer transport protein TolQ